MRLNAKQEKRMKKAFTFRPHYVAAVDEYVIGEKYQDQASKSQWTTEVTEKLLALGFPFELLRTERHPHEWPADSWLNAYVRFTPANGGN